MSAIDLEAEYNNRARVPEYPQIIEAWERDSAAYRRERASQSELALTYGPHPRQTIDVFYPDEPDSNLPILLFIHGGYWRSLEPRLFSHFAAGANCHGYILAVPGYRLCPEVSILEVIADVRAACVFLHRRFGRTLVATGHSAGGHLAVAMAATDWKRTDLEVSENLVRQALAISGLFELSPLIQTSVNESLRLDDATAAAASPAFWSPPHGAAVEAWVGASESSEYFRQAKLLADRWEPSGARVHVGVLHGLNHFTAPNPLGDPESELTGSLLRLARAGAATHDI